MDTVAESPTEKQWRLSLAPGLVALGLLGVVAWPLLHGQFRADTDLLDQFIPWRSAYALALSRGEAGFWNPFLSCGFPSLGEGQGGILHPVHLLLYLLVPLELACGLELGAYHLFAFGGMYLLLRRGLGRDPLPALVGGALFAFSPFLLAHFMHPNLAWVYAHLPWACWAVERTLRGSRPGRALGWLVALFASMILLGHPQTVWFNALATVWFAGWLVLTPGGVPGPRPRFTALALGLLAALLIGMVQLLPTLDFYRQSPRRVLPPAELTNVSLHPLNLLGQVLPGVFRNHFVPDPLMGADGRVTYAVTPEYASYLGVSVLLLLTWGLILGYREFWAPARRRATAFALLGTVLALLLSLGKYGGLIYLLGEVPILGSFRSPARYFGLVAFAVALGAAAVVQLMVERQEEPGPQTPGWALVLPALVPVVALGVVWWLRREAPEGNYLNLSGQRVMLGDGIELAGGPLKALLALVIFGAWYWARRSDLLALLCAFCLLDGAMINLRWFNVAPRHALTVASVTRDAMNRTDHTFRCLSRLNRDLRDGHYLATGYLGLWVPEELDHFGARDRRLLLPSDYLSSVVAVYVDGKPRTVTGYQPLPRARLVPTLRVVPDPLALLPTTALEDLRTTAWCRPGLAAELTGPPLTGEEHTVLANDGLSEVRVSVTVAHRRLLVLADRWWPGWRAEVDGSRVPIIPLYGRTFRGVIVEPGTHQVRFHYVCTAFWWGVVAALAGVAVLVFALRTVNRLPAP